VQGSEIIKRFKDIPIELDAHFKKRFVAYKACSIEIGTMCLESYPCKHNCVIYYENGEKVTKMLSGRDICDFFYDSLSEYGKAHFNYLRPDSPESLTK
jgi:hypothetical protein